LQRECLSAAYSVEILDVWPKPGCTRSEIAGSLSI
jgi:hypothetical protein